MIIYLQNSHQRDSLADLDGVSFKVHSFDQYTVFAIVIKYVPSHYIRSRCKQVSLYPFILIMIELLIS